MPTSSTVRIVPAAKPQSPPASRARAARRDLLDRIAEFLMKHDLEVTGANLAAIGDALSGANTVLARALVAREIAGEPIDQHWLDTLIQTESEADRRVNQLERLMDRAENVMLRFAQTAQSAVDQTCEQRGALGEHIAELSERRRRGFTPDGMDRVIDLSKAMMRRIVEAERAMARSQSESDALRANLAEARQEADNDHLTGLPNRRAFERHLETAAQEAQASGQKLCVGFCDVDHFKAVNDTHGHDAGDRVLVAIAATFKRYMGDNCFVARHGGEEFVLLFRGMDLEAALRRLDTMRQSLAAKRLVNRETGEPFGKITFSGGVTEVKDADDTREALARADEALYEAKRSGRDRIVAI